MNPKKFRNIIGRFPTGVSVVTTQVGDLIHGMTANSITSVSLDPLLLLVCVGRDSTCHDQLIATDRFAVNLLSEDQVEVSNHFARPSEPGVEHGEIAFTSGETGVPLIDGCLGYIECSKYAEYDGGDHVIFVGEVETGELAAPEARPLVFFAGDYNRLEQPSGDED